MSIGEPFSRPISVGTIPTTGKLVSLVANADELRRLADAMGILEVTGLSTEVLLRPIGAGAFTAKGKLEASVVQTDVVTLDPVAQQIVQTIDLVLRPAEGASGDRSKNIEVADAEEADTYENGRIDVARIAAEHLALGLDPYPRGEGIEFKGYIEDDPEKDPSPFAALAVLRRPER